jgi:nitrogen fixation protein FixH
MKNRRALENIAMTTNAKTSAAPKRGKVWVWPTIIVSLLLFQIGLSVGGAYMVMRGKSTVIEDDYYNKALHWDDYIAQEQASRKLGWTSDLAVRDGSGAQGVMGHRTISVALNDSKGQPVDAATIHMVVFHHAHATDCHDVILHPVQPGVYQADVPMSYAGTWEFRFTVTRGHEMYINKVQRELAQIAKGA